VTFSIFSCFCISNQLFQAPHKAVILSEALRRSIANRGLCSAEPKDPGDACWQMLLGAFRPQTTPEDKKSQALSEALTDSSRDTGLDGAASKNVEVASGHGKMRAVLFPAPGKDRRGSARCGLRWLKSSERHRQDKHPRGPSTPRHQARCPAISARRSAQDDVFVGVLKKNIPNKLALMVQPQYAARRVAGNPGSCIVRHGANFGVVYPARLRRYFGKCQELIANVEIFLAISFTL
jgi:hypothetical protein